MSSTQSEKVKRSGGELALMIVGIVLCVVFGLMLIFNITIIIKGAINPDEPPSMFGVTPLVVMSGSMSGDRDGHIEVGDMIFVTEVNTDDLDVDDVITFKQGKSYVTHRIVETGVDEKTGERTFTTKGDANNTNDQYPTYENEVVGIYRGKRLPGVGALVLFMQRPLGVAVFIGIPLILFFVYDFIRKKKHAASEQSKTAALEAEIERLRAAAGEKPAEKADEGADKGADEGADEKASEPEANEAENSDS